MGTHAVVCLVDAAVRQRTIAEVANLSGFKSNVSLSVIFRREVGLTPSQYRAQRSIPQRSRCVPTGDDQVPPTAAVVGEVPFAGLNLSRTAGINPVALLCDAAHVFRIAKRLTHSRQSQRCIPGCRCLYSARGVVRYVARNSDPLKMLREHQIQRRLSPPALCRLRRGNP